MLSSGPSSAPAHAAPTLNASHVDVSPEKGFFKSVWSKVVDVYTSTFKADERMDRLQKMPAHQEEIKNAVHGWREYSDKVDPVIRADVKTVSGVIGSIVEASGTKFSEAMDKLNQSFKDVTGYTAHELTPDRRNNLSVDQRAKLADIYNKMKTELSAGKTPYNDTAKVVNEVSAAVTDLVDLDTKQRDALKVDDKPGTFSTFGDTDLLAPALQAIAPGIHQKLEAIYSQARAKVFGDFAESEGVKTSALDKIRDAIATAKTSLAGISKLVSDVVTKATETAEHFKKNEAVRNDILSGVAPTDATKKVAYVSPKSLDALRAWFDAKSTTAEGLISGTFATAMTQEAVAAWTQQAQDFGVTSEQYRGTLKAVGASLTPFTQLIDEKTAPETFANTVETVKGMVEAAAVSFVETLAHDEAMNKLAALKALSVKIAERATTDLASGGQLTEDEKRLLVAEVKIALEALKTGSTKSWLN